MTVTIDTIFGTSWCSDCKRTKAYLGEQRISFEWVDIGLGTEESEQHAKFVESKNDGKRKVPTILFSDGSVMVEPSNAALAEKLGIVTDLGHVFHDVVIVGGGPAGLTAAMYLARDGYDVVVIEKGSLGGQASFTQIIENYPGFPDGIAGGELADRIVEQCRRFNVEFLKATEIVTVKKHDNYCVVITSTDAEITSSAIIIATGSKYRQLHIPGEADLIGYKLHFCATCDGPFYKDKEIAVIGGGNSALEESMFLSRFARKVTIYARSDIKATKALKEKAMEDNNIYCEMYQSPKEFLIGEKKSLQGVKMINNKTNEEFVIHPAGVFIFIGLTPNVDFIELNKDEGGFVVTDMMMKTSVEGVFAAGDCRSGSVKQAVSAMGEGAAVALSVREYLRHR